MAAKTTGEAPRARHAVFDQRLAPVVPFLDQTIAHGKTVALDGGAPVGTDADLRKARDLLGEFFRLRASTTLGGEVFAQANLQTLVRRHFSSRQDDFQSPALAYDAWQAHGSSIDQGHAPATTIDAEIGLLGHHPEIAPQAQFHSSRDRGPLDGTNHRLVQFEPRRAKRSARDFAAIAPRACGRDVELTERIFGVERADVFEVPARAE